MYFSSVLTQVSICLVVIKHGKSQAPYNPMGTSAHGRDEKYPRLYNQQAINRTSITGNFGARIDA